MAEPTQQPGPEPIDSALPSPAARLLALFAIILAGVCGGLIGWKVTELSTSGDSQVLAGVVGLLSAAFSAGGVAVVCVLVLRAMGEWQTIVESGDPAAARKQRS